MIKKIKAFKNWIKRKWKALLIALGIVGIAVAMGGGLGTNEISKEKLTQKYNASNEVKAEYQLEECSLVKPAANINEVKVRIGDENSADFVPNMELTRWDETRFKLKPNLVGIDTKDKTLKLEGNKIKFGTPKIDYEMYSYDEGVGGYKFIWYLKEKPLNNIVEFQIESEGLNFWYQPELTQEEIDEGCERPENVVGSYAVYHSTKGGWDVNGAEKQYKVGKAFHIFRPHLIDKNGLETWGELFIDAEQGIYRITIPQAFLDKAVYPIRSNDTFGYTTEGSNTYTLAGLTDGGTYLYRRGPQGIPEFTGTLDNVKFYGKHSTFGDISADVTAFVNEKDSVASNSHGQIGAHEIENATFGSSVVLYTINFSSENVTASTSYIISLSVNPENFGYGNSAKVMYDSISNTYYEELFAYGSSQYGLSKESPWTDSGTTASRKFSIYATYTPSGGAAPKIQRNIIIIE